MEACDSLLLQLLAITYADSVIFDQQIFPLQTSNSLTVSDSETGLGVFLLQYNLIIEVCTRMWGEDSSEECKQERKYLSTGVLMCRCRTL